METENMQTLGDVLKDYKDPKVKSNIDRKTEIINEITSLVKGMSYSDTVDETKAKMKVILGKCYTGHNLEKQHSYLNKKRTTEDVISMGYNTILMKENGLNKIIEASEMTEGY